ncbi:MAG: restriction endonuclease [Candidatus Dadabacteria bacterium]|nr:MAG: restriction endonuclease [Candidatus Dadabacteria bacterium]
MSIPDYQSIMYPLLELLRDGQTRSLRECIELLSSHFGLTRQERSQLLPSGQQPVFDNRVGWARTYLKKAGLLESPGRGLVRITPRGRKAVEQAGPRLDVNFLMQFEEFRDFRCRSQARRADLRGKAGGKNADPVERIEQAFNDYQDTLVDELLGQIRTASPAFFERLVIRLLVKMGYGGGLSEAATVVGGSGDEGIDGVINEDKLGLDVIYVQAKQWSNPVGRPEVQKFVGAFHGKRAKKGVFLTSSVFTKEAAEYVKHLEPRVVLVDGEHMARLMIEHDVGVTTKSVYELKSIDRDFFDEAS